MKARPSKPASSPMKLSRRIHPPALKDHFPVVAIGASAGGLEAFKDFFHALPSDTGMAFVLIQHLDPSHESMLTEIIAKTTTMPVEEVRSGASILPNHVYVIPPNALMALTDGAFQLSPRDRMAGRQLAVNFFMHSLAQEQKSGAIGIVLSGTGADGTSGMEEIKAEGGITFAQDPETAKYDGMPRSVIDSGCADFILAPKDMAKELRRIQHHPYVHLETRDAKPPAEELTGEKLSKEGQGSDESGADGSGEEPSSAATPFHARDLTAILAQLREASGVDFSQYKPNTIHRRTLRRMLLLKIDSLPDYAAYLKEHPEEGQKLYDDVLIPVTSFFRDFEAFEALKAQVYPTVVKDKGNKGTIRMWAPGCSTGEETYSLAMTLLEFLGDRASSFHVQIFGTDLNEKGIQKARAGVYRESIADEISPERMARFFLKVEDGYRVNKTVRDMCIFARQNVANDPPFSQMNLVACRNLLIYIQPLLQKKIIPILHYALKPSGFLVLGNSESVSAFPQLFSTVDKKHKIYAKKAVASRLHYDFVQSYYPAQSGLSFPGKAPKNEPAGKGELDLQAEADRVVLREHSPAGVVINSEMEVVQFRGQTTPYLAPPPGKPSVNLLKLARNGLAVELRALISVATRKGGSARKEGVAFGDNGYNRLLNLSVTPLGDKRVTGQEARDRQFFLILFEDVTPQFAPATGADSQQKSKGRDQSGRETRRLKQELANTRDALRSAMESDDSLREQYQSANEEILSANEELQSTNEELETSKEELQSTNEELGTLNSELRSKNSELHDLSNDISNLLNSTRIPVVMLDRQLRIRRITPMATKLFKVLAADIGRPFTDIKLNIDPSDMTSHDLDVEIAKVLDSLQPVEREVRDLEGHWHRLNILPYRTQDNKIDGAVLALQDIDAVKFANEQLAKSANFFRGIIDTVREPLLVLDHEQRVVAANESFLSTFEVSSKQIVKRSVYELGNGQWNIPALRGVLDRVLVEEREVTDFEVRHDFEDIGNRIMLLNARRLIQPDQSQLMILLAIEDITERTRMIETLSASEERFRALFNLGPVAIYYCDASGVIQNFNRRAAELWGRTPAAGDTDERICGSHKLLWPNGIFMPHEQSPMAQVLNGAIPEVRDQEAIIERPDGSRVTVIVNIRRLENSDGELTGAINCFYDITERKQSEVRLGESEERFRMVADNMSQLAWTCDQFGHVTWYNQRWLDYTGMTLEEMEGWNWSKVQHPDHLDRVVQGVKHSQDTGEIWEDTFPLRGKDGKYRWFLSRAIPIRDADGNVARWFGTNTDITESKLSEAALIKSEKLAAAGRMAAALAHEINNPLQAIANLVNIWAQSPGLDAQGRACAAMAEGELRRVTHLTRQALSFYRESSAPTPVNVEETIDSILDVYKKRIEAKRIQISKRYRLNGTMITTYPGEFRQVLSTLLLNAMDAIDADGVIAIRVREAFHSRNTAVHGVRISIFDNGTGIPASNVPRIFEPFFTTKGDAGTGLGLWVASGIVNRSGGSILTRSTVDPVKHGTCFAIFLPTKS